MSTKTQDIAELLAIYRALDDSEKSEMFNAVKVLFQRQQSGASRELVSHDLKGSPPPII